MPSFEPEVSVFVNNSGVVVSFPSWDEAVDTGVTPDYYRIVLQCQDCNVSETQQIDGDESGNLTLIMGHPEQSDNYTIHIIPILEREGTIYEGNGPHQSFAYSDQVTENGEYGFISKFTGCCNLLVANGCNSLDSVGCN